MQLFLDTSALLSVFDKSDQHHREASRWWKEIYERKSQWREILITDYILDELVTRIRQKIHHGKAVQILNSLLKLDERNVIRLVWIDDHFFSKAKQIFERYKDQNFSFTDCTSFAVCQEKEVPDAFSLDEHFDVFRLTRYPQ